MDTDRSEGVQDNILQVKKPFIPTAEMRNTGWLTKTSHTKTAWFIVVEFTRAKDANKLIDEGLVWWGEVFGVTDTTGSAD
jgi:hypothetical protein